MAIGAIVRQLREEAGLSQAELAERVHVSQQSIDALESGRVRKPKYIVELADALSVKPQSLLRSAIDGLSALTAADTTLSQGTIIRSDGFVHAGHDFTPLPVFDIAASAGPGSLLENEAEQPLYHEFRPLDWAQRMAHANLEDLALVWVRGDSMEPTLRHNDQILVDRGRTSPANPGLFVLRIGEEVVVKRLEMLMNQQSVRVISDNERYSTEEMAPENLTILARVVWLGREIG